MRRLMFALWIMAFGVSCLAARPVRADDEKAPPKKDEKKLVEEDVKSKDKTADEKDKSKDKDKAKKPDPIKKLVEMRIDQFVIPARQLNVPLPGRTQTTQDLLDRLNKWSKDDEVGGVLLNLDGLNLGLPDVEELRAGVTRVRQAGKKVFAFVNSGDDMGYLLGCEADEIAIAPTGSLGLPGIGRLFPFTRGNLQMQGIEYDVITAGRFKYPGFLTAREPNKHFAEEFDHILDSWYGDYVRLIASGRKLSEQKVKDIIDVALFDAKEAKNRGLVDTIAYYDEYKDRVIRRTKMKKADDSESTLAGITSLQDLLTIVSKQMKDAQEGYKAVGPKIAVLHARGPIIDQNLGAGLASSMIMRDEFVKSIEEIRKNKTIRAVVLHVDSPGGSGYASDVIWRKLRELDEEKPLVVSMGNVAGSGGYFIACPARLIFALPTTITGSIGVIAMLPNQASMLNRQDINLAEMKRGARALFGSGHRDILPEDREFLQSYILDFYEIFLDRVAAGRKMPKDEVRKIAEGRIYTGRDALKIGLVDRLGGLEDAIKAVREMADIPASAEVKIVHYPRPSSLGELAESFLGMQSMTEVSTAGLLQALTMAERSAPRVGFDLQCRLFAQRVQPLCWMAMPEIGSTVSSVLPGTMPASIDELTGIKPIELGR